MSLSHRLIVAAMLLKDGTVAQVSSIDQFSTKIVCPAVSIAHLMLLFVFGIE